jgi:hypothetical protein
MLFASSSQIRKRITMSDEDKLDTKKRQAPVDALDDGYKSHEPYTQVIRDFGEVRPFINIVDAEPRHTAERERLAGALDLLSNLHAEMATRRDEANSDAARETLDETLSLLASLITEYRRRYERTKPMPKEHASYVFLLDDAGGVHPLPHGIYVELAKGGATAPEFAGQQMRVADWYVRTEAGTPVALVNENYALMKFDAAGRVDWVATPSFHSHRNSAALASESTSLPSPQERERMLELVFGLRPEE